MQRKGRRYIFSQLISRLLIIPEDLLFPVALSSDGEGVIANGGNEVDAVKAEAITGCEFKKWGGLVHMMALASVIRRPNYLVYPNVAFRYRALMRNVLMPRLPPVNDDPMWHGMCQTISSLSLGIQKYLVGRHHLK